VLAFAAMLGRQFHFDDLLRLGLPLVDATVATQRALRAGLLRTHDDCLEFASELLHAVVRDAIPEPIRIGVDRRLRTLMQPHLQSEQSWSFSSESSPAA
jgi:hypothetical protein